MTVHFITCKEFTRKQVVLQAIPFNESHTGINISNTISSCLQSWEVAEKLTYIVRDNAANYVAALRHGGFPNFGCMAHTLQLVIHDGVLIQRGVQQLLGTARKIVGHYKHSNTAYHILKRFQEQLSIPQHTLIQDQATRWNSSFYMLQRLVEQKVAILAAGGAESNCNYELRAEQWSLAEKVVHLLKPFEEATMELSREDASVSLVIPIVLSLKRFLSSVESSPHGDHGITSMKQKMLQSVSDRYNNVGTCICHYDAMSL